MIPLKQYKKEIISAFLGAAFTGVASLSVGLYSVTKSFEYTQNKEIIYGVRKDIEYLRRIETEIDENISLMLVTNYEVFIEFSAPINMVEAISESKKDNDKEMSDKEKEIMGSMFGSMVKITKLQTPREELIIDAWEFGFPQTSDINFDLLKEINDYYRIARRVNKTIERMINTSQGSSITEGFSDRIKKDTMHHNQILKQLKNDDIILLKNKVNKEIERLNLIRKELTDVARKI